SAQYLALHAQARDDAHLLALEVEHFQVTPGVLGAELLRACRVDSVLCDALRYQHEALAPLRGASRLVKLAWLGSRLASAEASADLQGLSEGAALLGLDLERLRVCPARAWQALGVRAQQLGLRFAPGPRLPLTLPDARAAAAEDEVARLQFRHLVQCHSLFTTMRWGREPAAMEAAIGFNLGLLFGLRHYSLF